MPGHRHEVWNAVPGTADEHDRPGLEEPIHFGQGKYSLHLRSVPSRSTYEHARQACESDLTVERSRRERLILRKRPLAGCLRSALARGGARVG
ncbi:hypothetical protein SBBP2_2660004 [Burkholderiales bacterium]|nr:hypothetical protein SBBP2_2660004 [Burkholderiales bacterium]